MKKNKPDPEMIDNDNPEWTDDMFQNAKRGPDALRDIFGTQADTLINKKIGRPTVSDPKEQVTLRLNASLLNALRATGHGWQTRLNDTLIVWAKENGILHD